MLTEGTMKWLPYSAPVVQLYDGNPFPGRSTRRPWCSHGRWTTSWPEALPAPAPALPWSPAPKLLCAPASHGSRSLPAHTSCDFQPVLHLIVLSNQVPGSMRGHQWGRFPVLPAVTARGAGRPHRAFVSLQLQGLYSIVCSQCQMFIPAHDQPQGGTAASQLGGAFLHL